MSLLTDATTILAGLPTTVAVTHGGSSTNGPLILSEVVESDGSGGERTVKRYVLRIPTGSLPLLDEHEDIVAGGVTYRVRRILDESLVVQLLHLVKA